ncbi:MAG: VapC toxin family PIN domain ribonuclease [Acidobacteria bacterium]|nr:MAG: VapC toxin family PIN domain ribonuclease [Acidobacteriota bacterium]
MIVVDTNVVSELMRPEPDPAVRDWVLARPSGELCTTSITVAEILYGIERLPKGRRKEILKATAIDVFGAFEDQVLPFDETAALCYPEIVDARDRRGVPIDGFDAQVASICRAHGSALLTRNVKDFRYTGIKTIDPWRRK